MNLRRVPTAAAAAFLRLLVAFCVFGLTRCRGSASTVGSCRQQIVFDIYNGFACDVIVASSSDDDDLAVQVMMASSVGKVPRNASALRLTLRRATAAASLSGQTGSRPLLPHLPQLLSLEVDVSETRSFPAGLPSKLGATQLQRLILFRSALTHISEYRLRLPTSELGTFSTTNSSLKTLILSDLGIEQLPARTFDGLTALCFLLINNNLLSSLPSGLFDDLCQLSSLSLALNRFVDIEDLSLVGSGQTRCGGGLSRLRSLNLHGNRLRSLRAGAFRSLSSVVELNLSGNELSEVDTGAFSGLVELRTLYLDANRLVTVVPGMFHSLTSLTTLDVGQNHLSDLASGAFQYLTALRTLRLNENEIQVILSDTWEGLDELIELDMATNLISAVNESMFDGLCSLQKLDLSDNELKVTGAEAFVCLTALQRLDLSGNQLPDAERRRLEDRRWWSNGGSCEKCGRRTLTTTSAETNLSLTTCGQLIGLAIGPCNPPSSSSAAVVQLRDTTHLVTVVLTVGGAVTLLLLTFAVAVRLLRGRGQRFATFTYSPHSGSVKSTLDDSVDGLYVKFHT